MSPQAIGAAILRSVPLLHDGEAVHSAVATIVESGMPALPVVNDSERLCGIFGEREFMAALFPGYLRELEYAAFVPRSLDAALEKRSGCSREPVAKHMNTEHVDVPSDYSDAQVAETFLHHRVLIIPVVDKGTVHGIITRSDFFRGLAKRFLDENR